MNAIILITINVVYFYLVYYYSYTLFLYTNLYIHILYSMYGHPDTTGIPNMDYFVTSKVEPESAQVTYIDQYSYVLY